MAEAERAAREIERNRKPAVPWSPIPNSPQEVAVTHPADELFFGGGAGGGKTDLLIGLAIMCHQRSIIFRRRFKDLQGLRERSAAIYTPYGGFNGQREIWRLTYQCPRVIEFGAVQFEEDWAKFQGRPNDLVCVGRGTPVRMGDGSLKPVEQITLGDAVLTLEGPRAVRRLLPIRRDLGVLVRAYDATGRLLATQVQSRTHSLLGPEGWRAYEDAPCEPTLSDGDQVSSSPTPTIRGASPRSNRIPPLDRQPSAGQLLRIADRPAICLGAEGEARAASRHMSDGPRLACFSASTGSRCASPSDAPTQRQSLGLPRSLGTPSTDRPPAFGLNLPRRLRQDSLASFVCALATGAESDCGSFGDQPQASALHLSATGLASRPPLWPPAAPTQPQPPALARDGCGASELSSPPDCLENCSAGCDPCDGLPRVYLCCHPGSDADQGSPLPPAGAAPPIPSCSGADGRDETPTRSPRTRTYVHPYTKEIRRATLGTDAAYVTYEPLGEVDLFDLEVEQVNHYITYGGFVNKNCFDEVTHFSQTQYRRLIGWNRTHEPGQRVRVIATGNPPTSAEGDWVISYWGPWLDRAHPNPAKDGEVRWYATIKGEDIEVDGPDLIRLAGEKEAVKPRSRSFIKARVQDNPHLMRSGYMSVLQALPEPMRSQMLFGDFEAGQEDDAQQVIPTTWILAAQARWTDQPPGWVDAIGVDVARGGADKTVLSLRHGPWLAPQRVYQGESTPDGPMVAQLVFGAIPAGQRPVVLIDVIGVGSSPYDHALQMGLDAHPMNASAKSYERDKTGQLGFVNLRAEWWWKMREMLDPDSGEEVALPPDRELRADLTAPRWKMALGGIQIESKDDIRERIARSPDKGDSAVLAFAQPRRRSVNRMI